MSLPSDYHQEAAHLNLQNNQEQLQDLVFSIIGHVSAVDPTTNKIKAVIPSWTNDDSTFMETGWIPLGSNKAGNKEGIQILPFGGASIKDITGQKNNPNASPEQVLIHVLGRKRAFYVAGVQTFNQQDIPPSGYNDNISNIKIQPGEWLFKHATGSFLYFSNENVITINALTNPAPVLQTDQVSNCTETLNLLSTADGENSNKNGHKTPATTANINITSDASGASGTTDSNINVTAQQTSADSQAVNTSTIDIEANISAGSVGNANLNLKATADGADTDSAQFTLESSIQDPGTANGTINIDASTVGTATLDINVTGTLGTMTITVTESGIFSVSVPGGAVNVDAEEVNVTATAVTVEATTVDIVAAGVVTITATGNVDITAAQANVISAAVVLGTGTAKPLLNIDGPCTNVFGS